MMCVYRLLSSVYNQWKDNGKDRFVISVTLSMLLQESRVICVVFALIAVF